RRGEGELRDLGAITMRVLADAEVSKGLLSVLEFRGSAGPWTIPHIHHDTAETFFVLEGRFDFLCGPTTHTLDVGDYILVPPDTRHMMAGDEGGGSRLGINAPGGLEDMFRALSELPANSVRDPETRRHLAERYDATPA